MSDVCTGSSNVGPSKPKPLSWGRLLLVVAWTLFIWSRSLYPGVDSRAQSGFVLTLLQPGFEFLGILDTELMTFIIRKTAHFLEYTVLGILLALAKNTGEKPVSLGANNLGQSTQGHTPSNSLMSWLPFIVYGIVVPSIDETIQLFVPERSGQLTDVMLDCAGVAFGFAIGYWYLQTRQGLS